MHDDIHTEMAVLKKDIEQLRQEVKLLSTDIQDLVQAWKTANTLVGFIKWTASIAGAVTVIGAFSWEFWKK